MNAIERRKIETSEGVWSEVYSEADIATSVEDYADYHEVGTDEVDVTRNTCRGAIVGYRLSLDFDGTQKGHDEKIGEWN